MPDFELIALAYGRPLTIAFAIAAALCLLRCGFIIGRQQEPSIIVGAL